MGNPNAVPYKLVPDKIRPACGSPPSVEPLKLYRVVKPVPLVLMLNTVPPPKLPYSYVVPYKLGPDKIKPPNAPAPSLTPLNLYRVVKPVKPWPHCPQRFRKGIRI